MALLISWFLALKRHGSNNTDSFCQEQDTVKVPASLDGPPVSQKDTTVPRKRAMEDACKPLCLGVSKTGLAALEIIFSLPTGSDGTL